MLSFWHVCLNNCQEHQLMLFCSRLQVFKSLIFSGSVLFLPKFCYEKVCRTCDWLLNDFRGESWEENWMKFTLSNLQQLILLKDIRRVCASIVYCLVITLRIKWISRIEMISISTPFFIIWDNIRSVNRYDISIFITNNYPFINPGILWLWQFISDIFESCSKILNCHSYSFISTDLCIHKVMIEIYYLGEGGWTLFAPYCDVCCRDLSSLNVMRYLSIQFLQNNNTMYSNLLIILTKE